MQSERTDNIFIHIAHAHPQCTKIDNCLFIQPVQKIIDAKQGFIEILGFHFVSK